MIEDQSAGASLERFGSGWFKAKGIGFLCSELRCETAHLIQGLAEFSDVVEGGFDGSFRAAAVETKEFSIGAKMRCTTIEDPPVFPGVVLQPIGHCERNPFLERADIVLHATFKVLRMHAFGPAVAGFLPECATAEIQPGAVEIEASHVHS